MGSEVNGVRSRPSGPTLDQLDRLQVGLQVENQRRAGSHHRGNLEALQQEACRQRPGRHGNGPVASGTARTCAVRRMGWVAPAPGPAGRRNVPPAVCVRMRGGA